MMKREDLEIVAPRRGLVLRPMPETVKSSLRAVAGGSTSAARTMTLAEWESKLATEKAKASAEEQSIIARSEQKFQSDTEHLRMWVLSEIARKFSSDVKKGRVNLSPRFRFKPAEGIIRFQQGYNKWCELALEGQGSGNRWLLFVLQCRKCKGSVLIFEMQNNPDVRSDRREIVDIDWIISNIVKRSSALAECSVHGIGKLGKFVASEDGPAHQRGGCHQHPSSPIDPNLYKSFTWDTTGPWEEDLDFNWKYDVRGELSFDSDEELEKRKQAASR